MKGLYTVLLLLWIAGGTFLANKKYCQASKAKAASAASAAAATTTAPCDKTIAYQDGDFSISSEDNFTFKINKSGVLRPSEQLREFLTSLSDYLNNNTDRTVLVQGLYSSKEKTPSDFEDLGLARASKIKSFLEQSYKVSEDQIKLGSEVTSSCFSKKTETLRKGVILTPRTK